MVAKIIAKVPNAGFNVAEVASGSEMSFIDKNEARVIGRFCRARFSFKQISIRNKPNEGVGERFYLSEIGSAFSMGVA